MWEEHSALVLLPATEELIKQADEDLEAFREKVKKKKRRRAVPQGSTPIELTQILLLPNYRLTRRSDALANTTERAQYVIDKTASDEENEGIEQPRKYKDDKTMMKAATNQEDDVFGQKAKWKIANKLRTTNFYRLLRRLFIHIRRCQMSPLVWYRSDGFESAKGKGNKSNPAENWRWLHIMDPWGSVWHSTILANANENRSEHGAKMPPDYTHAYLPNRSREAPIAVMEIMAHRLRQAGVSFVRNQYDGKNVFRA